nr:TPR-repeat-containing protein [uncultured bacterium]
MKSKIILKILIIFSFTGCYNREQNSLLNEAEALLQNKPDSALSILQQFTPGSQQAEQAKYALLYSAALDQNHIKITSDSLIRKAWNYYKHHPKDLRNQCTTLYYWGRIKLRANDKAGALRLFLEIEKKLKDTNEPYYKGLLYSQIVIPSALAEIILASLPSMGTLNFSAKISTYLLKLVNRIYSSKSSRLRFV